MALSRSFRRPGAVPYRRFRQQVPTLSCPRDGFEQERVQEASPEDAVTDFGTLPSENFQMLRIQSTISRGSYFALCHCFIF